MAGFARQFAAPVDGAQRGAQLQTNEPGKERIIAMRVVIIGGSGHIGTYLIPRLAAAGYDIINVSRGQRAPYQQHAAWQAVRHVTLDRSMLEAEGSFGQQIRDLAPDIVIDLICFTLASARHLTQALHGGIQLLIHCGTIWVHGPSSIVPATEDLPRHPFGEYGIQKAAIEAYLLDHARRSGFPATIVHPGHIVGPGWAPLNPAGHFNPEVFIRLARGEPLALPNLGMETVHHVHADDVAQWIIGAIEQRASSIGEVFNTVSSHALSLRGYAEAMYRWFGYEPRLSFAPFDEWKLGISESDAHSSWGHIMRSSCISIEKSRQRLGYNPRFSSLEAIHQSVTALIASGRVAAPENHSLRG